MRPRAAESEIDMEQYLEYIVIVSGIVGLAMIGALLWASSKRTTKHLLNVLNATITAVRCEERARARAARIAHDETPEESEVRAVDSARSA